VHAVRRLASERGVSVIEDAAQAASASLLGRRLGSLGDLSVLSFGRGKGLCAGGGGALLGFEERWASAIDAIRLPGPGRGWSGLAKTAVQWALGRPSLYAAPSMLPWLHLGEMVYHEAGEPTAMSSGSTALLRSAFDLEGDALMRRRLVAAALDGAAPSAPRLATTVPIAGAEPGYLRYAVRDLSGSRPASASLGVVRPYPRATSEQPEMAPVLMPGEPATPGALTLARSLFTLPVHRFVNRGDIGAMERWLRDAGRGESAADRRGLAPGRLPEMVLMPEHDAQHRVDHGDVGGRREGDD
jgi:hypothetical protein